MLDSELSNVSSLPSSLISSHQRNLDGGFLQDSPLSFLKYQDIDGMTPLMAAVDKDHVQTAKLLLDEVSSAKKKKVSILRFGKRI